VKRKLRITGYCLIICLIAAQISLTTACSKKTATRTLSSIAVTPNSPAHLVVNQVEPFTALGTYSDKSTADITSQVTWTSSSPVIGVTDSSGKVIGISAGITNITATMNNIISPPVTLTVIVLSSITVTPNSPVNLVVGAMQQFIATATYSDGSMANISSKVTWSSINPGLITIGLGGMVTGLAAGTTNITASMDGVTSPTVSLTLVTPAMSH
jgi:uncharacterized protein YjdB